MLVDKNIKKLCIENNLITDFSLDKLNSNSYDVSIDKFIINNEEISCEEYCLSSFDFVYVKVKECLNMPDNLCCMVIEKNSLMRMGLKVDGPLYQPGHKTNVYIRVFNISKSDIVLRCNMSVAQLVFFELNEVPMITYDKQKNSHYNDENKFRIY